MTGSDFIKRLTELTRAGKVTWTHNTLYKAYCYETTYDGMQVRVMSHYTFIYIDGETVYQDRGMELFNAITDTMPDIQQIFDNAIKELER